MPPETPGQFGCPIILAHQDQEIRLAVTDPITGDTLEITADKAIDAPEPNNFCELAELEATGGGRRFCRACKRNVSEQTIPGAPMLP